MQATIDVLDMGNVCIHQLIGGSIPASRDEKPWAHPQDSHDATIWGAATMHALPVEAALHTKLRTCLQLQFLPVCTSTPPLEPAALLCPQIGWATHRTAPGMHGWHWTAGSDP